MDNIKNIATNPSNLELIKIARELAYNDYNNRKASLHNQWLAESEVAWRLHKLKVSYPPIPDFPSETEILERANKLISFLNTPRPDLKEEPQQEVPVEQPVVEEPKVEEEKNSGTINDLEYARMHVAQKIGDSTVTSKAIPSVLQRLQDISLTWKK